MRIAVPLLLLFMTLNTLAQPHFRRPHSRRNPANAEMALKSAAEELEQAKEQYERDVKVLAHLRAAQKALTDTMQPHTSIEKAWDHTQKAFDLIGQDPGIVGQMTRRAHGAVVDARRSPTSADFDRVRAMIQDAIDPAGRVAAANALELEDQILDWIKVQQMISAHLRRMSEIAGESLRAAQ